MMCNRCILDDRTPGIVFDKDGVCNYCHLHDEMNEQYPISKQYYDELINRIKKDGEGLEYDAIIGISGGADSSYLLTRMHDSGVRCLAVNVDGGWNTKTATENMLRLTEKMDITFLSIKLNQKAYDSLSRSFLYASTPDADIPDDLSWADIVQKIAMENNVHWVLNGHSFRTEGSAPLGWTYMDGGYLEDVNKRFENTDLSVFPHLSWENQMKYFSYGIYNARPLYYLEYDKRKTISYLMENYGWEWYGSLHAENIYTKFVGKYLWMKKFNIDYRKVEYSALVRSGLMHRADAVRDLKGTVMLESYYLAMIKRRLGLSDEQLDRILRLPPKSYRDYNNYLPRFRSPELKEFFKGLLDSGKISMTFYRKYIEGV